MKVEVEVFGEFYPVGEDYLVFSFAFSHFQGFYFTLCFPSLQAYYADVYCRALLRKRLAVSYPFNHISSP